MSKRKTAQKTTHKKANPRRTWMILGVAVLVIGLMATGITLAGRSAAATPTATLPVTATIEAANPTLEAAATAMPLEISAVEAAALQAEGAFILDVRQPEEWNAGHIEGATLIPLGELNSRLSEVPQNVPVVVVCRSGNRSATGRDILLSAGYPSVTSMAGGMKAWAAAGYATVIEP